MGLRLMMFSEYNSVSELASGLQFTVYVICNVPPPTVEVKTVIGNLGPIVRP